MIGLLDYLPKDLLLDFIAENSNLPKTAPREQWFVISRDFCQRGRSDLALDGEAFGEVEVALHGYFLKPVAQQASWWFASWRLTFHHLHDRWYHPRDSRGLERRFNLVQCWNLSRCH